MLRIIKNADKEQLEKHLIKLNIIEYDKCIYKNVYCCVAEYDKESIENNSIETYNVQFFINNKNEIAYCTYPEERNEKIIIEKIYDLTKDNLLEKVDDKNDFK